MRGRHSLYPLLAVVLAGALLTGCKKKQSEDDESAEPESTSTPAAKEPAKAAAEAPAAAAGVGTVTGSVSFTGKAPDMPQIARQSDPVCAAKPMKANDVIVNDNKTLRDVFVRIAPGAVKGKFATPDGAVLVAQHDCMYEPRVQGAVAGQTIEIKNTDKTMHNVHTYKGQETILNQGQPAGSPDVKKEASPTDPGVLKFKCDVHPWMTGFVVVNDNPFFQTTGADGSFKLDKVPAGKYTIEAWHSKYGVKTTTVTVEANKTAEAKLSYAGDEKGE